MNISFNQSTRSASHNSGDSGERVASSWRGAPPNTFDAEAQAAIVDNIDDSFFADLSELQKESADETGSMAPMVALPGTLEMYANDDNAANEFSIRGAGGAASYTSRAISQYIDATDPSNASIASFNSLNAPTTQFIPNSAADEAFVDAHLSRQSSDIGTDLDDDLAEYDIRAAPSHMLNPGYDHDAPAVDMACGGGGGDGGPAYTRTLSGVPLPGAYTDVDKFDRGGDAITFVTYACAQYKFRDGPIRRDGNGPRCGTFAALRIEQMMSQFNKKRSQYLSVQTDRMRKASYLKIANQLRAQIYQFFYANCTYPTFVSSFRHEIDLRRGAFERLLTQDGQHAIIGELVNLYAIYATYRFLKYSLLARLISAKRGLPLNQMVSSRLIFGSISLRCDERALHALDRTDLPDIQALRVLNQNHSEVLSAVETRIQALARRADDAWVAFQRHMRAYNYTIRDFTDVLLNVVAETTPRAQADAFGHALPERKWTYRHVLRLFFARFYQFLMLYPSAPVSYPRTGRRDMPPSRFHWNGLDLTEFERKIASCLVNSYNAVQHLEMQLVPIRNQSAQIVAGHTGVATPPVIQPNAGTQAASYWARTVHYGANSSLFARFKQLKPTDELPQVPQATVRQWPYSPDSTPGTRGEAPTSQERARANASQVYAGRRSGDAMRPRSQGGSSY